ncbi:MAG TPA: succinyl-diaminopimelate desuccinylase [Oligoflexia bacterium]|nr:succinyl-diaminopimelate desuccinylase [Oligoflexia bacterium]HMP47588.1 succinyl-diaminopimelate desuccinylase [Oligoflexia bacterium]
MIDVVELSKQLIQVGSDLESDKLFCELLNEALSSCDFSQKRHSLILDGKEHTYFHLGSTGPIIAYLGHSDVVPVGDESLWCYPPFSGFSNDTTLFGRGAVDMRASVAAFISALYLSWKDVKDHIQVIVAIPSDEETSAFGASEILKDLRDKKLLPEVCLVGEPSALSNTGDKIRIGRRGGLSCTLNFKGEAGHTAYVSTQANILHRVIDIANKIMSINWPNDGHPWPAVSFHIVEFISSSGAFNVVPDNVTLKFNIRFGPGLSRDGIIKQIEEILRPEENNYSVKWSRGSKPYYTTDEKFREVIDNAIISVVGRSPAISVDGGTSDGRFFAAEGIPTIEVGTPAIKLHEINESVEIQDLKLLVEIYSQIIRNFAKAY